MYIQRRCRLKFFRPYAWSPVNKNEKKKTKKKRKNQKYKILKNKINKCSEDMVKIRYHTTKFGIICLTGSEKTLFADDGRPADERPRDDRLLSSAVQ